jgi:hypothetical protein
MAERTGLEPATPGVTGRYSNQLNYRSNKNSISTNKLPTPLGDAVSNLDTPTPRHYPFWWVLRVSNPRHSPCKGDALPLS